MKKSLHSLSFPSTLFLCLTICASSWRFFTCQQLNQLLTRLGRRSKDHYTSDQGEKGKGKPFKFLLLQEKKGSKNRDSPPGMILGLILVLAALEVSSDSPSAASWSQPKQQGFGSPKCTFLPQPLSKLANTSLHPSPACAAESCINPAPNGADESLPA